MKNITSPAGMVAGMNGDFDNLITACTDGGIEAQESAGQKTFVAQQTLPKNCPKSVLEQLGFVFGSDYDDIFINVLFPDGWTKVPTQHSMWNDLKDAKARVRGNIFYKAAFYDRSANMTLVRRFSRNKDWNITDGVQFIINDGTEVIHKTKLIRCKNHSDEYRAVETLLKTEATNWLNDHYPDWENEASYWDYA